MPNKNSFNQEFEAIENYPNLYSPSSEIFPENALEAIKEWSEGRGNLSSFGKKSIKGAGDYSYWLYKGPRASGGHIRVFVIGDKWLNKYFLLECKSSHQKHDHTERLKFLSDKINKPSSLKAFMERFQEDLSRKPKKRSDSESSDLESSDSEEGSVEQVPLQVCASKIVQFITAESGCRDDLDAVRSIFDSRGKWRNKPFCVSITSQDKPILTHITVVFKYIGDSGDIELKSETVQLASSFPNKGGIIEARLQKLAQLARSACLGWDDLVGTSCQSRSWLLWATLAKGIRQNDFFYTGLLFKEAPIQQLWIDSINQNEEVGDLQNALDYFVTCFLDKEEGDQKYLVRIKNLIDYICCSNHKLSVDIRPILNQPEKFEKIAQLLDIASIKRLFEASIDSQEVSEALISFYQSMGDRLPQSLWVLLSTKDLSKHDKAFGENHCLKLMFLLQKEHLEEEDVEDVRALSHAVSKVSSYTSIYRQAQSILEKIDAPHKKNGHVGRRRVKGKKRKLKKKPSAPAAVSVGELISSKWPDVNSSRPSSKAKGKSKKPVSLKPCGYFSCEGSSLDKAMSGLGEYIEESGEGYSKEERATLQESMSSIQSAMNRLRLSMSIFNTGGDLFESPGVSVPIYDKRLSRELAIMKTEKDFPSRSSYLRMFYEYEGQRNIREGLTLAGFFRLRKKSEPDFFIFDKLLSDVALDLIKTHDPDRESKIVIDKKVDDWLAEFSCFNPELYLELSLRGYELAPSFLDALSFEEIKAAVNLYRFLKDLGLDVKCTLASLENMILDNLDAVLDYYKKMKCLVDVPGINYGNIMGHVMQGILGFGFADVIKEAVEAGLEDCVERINRVMIESLELLIFCRERQAELRSSEEYTKLVIDSVEIISEYFKTIMSIYYSVPKIDHSKIMSHVVRGVREFKSTDIANEKINSIIIQSLELWMFHRKRQAELGGFEAYVKLTGEDGSVCRLDYGELTDDDRFMCQLAFEHKDVFDFDVAMSLMTQAFVSPFDLKKCGFAIRLRGRDQFRFEELESWRGVLTSGNLRICSLFCYYPSCTREELESFHPGRDSVDRFS